MQADPRVPDECTNFTRSGQVGSKPIVPLLPNCPLSTYLCKLQAPNQVTAAYEEAERALELMRQEGETEELAAE